jgi:two-component system response regulator YesN
VKPVAEEELEKLLQRAKEIIFERMLEQQRIVQLEQRLEEKVDVFFPHLEVNQLVDAMRGGDAKAVEYAGRIFEAVCTNLNYDLIKIESLLNSIMLEITNSISESCKWLNKFIGINEMGAAYFSKVKDLDSIKTEFISANEKILDTMKKLKYGTNEKEIVNQVCEFVLENIDEDISLSSVSNSLFMNKSYLSETFKQKTGISFIEYLTIVKMERAKKLIGDGRLKAYEVAELLGFKDIEYFSRLFKKNTGFTPTQYRQSIVAK